MSNPGYGRGYYGNAQLARPQVNDRPGGGWLKLVIAAGIGAAIWWWVIPAIWPKSKLESKYAAAQPSLPPPPLIDDLTQLAHSRGFASAQEYTDAVRAMVDELEAKGAKVVVVPAVASPAVASPAVAAVPSTSGS